MFFRPTSLEHDNYSIHPDWHLTFDYIPLTVNITIFEKNIQTKKCTIVKNSEEENNFIIELIKAIKKLNTENFQSKEALEHIVQSFTDCIERIWYKDLKIVHITKHFKEWWNDNYHRSLENYRQTKRIDDWNLFKSIAKKMKYNFFDSKIQEIANKKCSPWELINWVKKQKLLAIKAIQYNGYPCIKLEDLWQALHSSFNSAQSWVIDLDLLEEIISKSIMK